MIVSLKGIFNLINHLKLQLTDKLTGAILFSFIWTHFVKGSVLKLK